MTCTPCFPKPVPKPSWWRHPWKRIRYHYYQLRWKWDWWRLRKKGIKLPLIKNSNHGMSIDEITASEPSFAREAGLSWTVRRLKHGGGDPKES